MKKIHGTVLTKINGGRDRSFRSPQFQNNSGWSAHTCANLGSINDSLSVASFGASFIPGAQGFALISGTLGMMGFALDKQFCS
jgi:hypothetical protein